MNSTLKDSLGGPPRAPWHAFSVHFTVALTVMSFGFDCLAFFRVAIPQSLGWWLLVVDVPVTAVTLLTGFRSRIRLPVEEGAARALLRTHMALGPTFFGALFTAALYRAVLWEQGRVSVWYLAAMFAVVIIMAVQGYIGGELVYRFGAAVEGRYPRLPTVDMKDTRHPPYESVNVGRPR